MEMFLVHFKLFYERDGEQEVVFSGFLSACGQVAEFDNEEQALAAIVDLLSGTATWDTFEAWDVLNEPRPQIRSVTVMKAVEVNVGKEKQA